MHMVSTFMLSLSEPGGHGFSQKALEIAAPFGFPTTNSMIVMWIVAAGLILFAQLATRRLEQVPGGAQNLLGWLIEGVYALPESVIGPHLVDRPFWFLPPS